MRKFLSKGASGSVYLTVDEYAVKCVSKSSLTSTDLRTALKREIDVHRQLDHQHIVKLYAVYETPKEILLRMEYVGGNTLDYILQNEGPLKENKMTHIIW